MSLPLCELYRPKEFNEIVGVKDLSGLYEITKSPENMPNLLFYGSQGTGKTSTAKVIIDKLKPIDVLKLNGSNKNDRNIETISNKIESFGMSKSTVDDKPKIIFIDECDNLTPDAFQSLRGVMEKIVKNARFICTCNYISKVPEPIQSRFTLFEFGKLSKEDIVKRVKFICEKEHITVSNEVLDKIAESSRGDIRTAINNVQKLSSNPAKTITDFKEGDSLAQEVYKLILEKEWGKLRYEIPQKYPDYDALLVELDNLFFNSGLPANTKVDANEIIADSLFRMYFSYSKDILFAACCSKLMKVI
jgi:replication factor C small subunit